MSSFERGANGMDDLQQQERYLHGSEAVMTAEHTGKDCADTVEGSRIEYCIDLTGDSMRQRLT